LPLPETRQQMACGHMASELLLDVMM